MENKVQTGSRKVEEGREQEGDEIFEKKARGIEEERKIEKEDRRKRRIIHKSFLSWK